MEHSIELIGGYVDKKNVRHTRVTFGKRLTAKDMFSIDSDPQSDVSTQHLLLVIRMAITAFGQLSVPVDLGTLLELDSTDIEILFAGYNEFAKSGLDLAPTPVPESSVRLVVGYESNGLVYNIATFGKRINGRDLVEADRKNFSPLKRAMYLVGKQVTKLSTVDGGSTIDGPLEISLIEKLDAGDLTVLSGGAANWGDSFRRERARV